MYNKSEMHRKVYKELLGVQGSSNNHCILFKAQNDLLKKKVCQYNLTHNLAM